MFIRLSQASTTTAGNISKSIFVKFIQIIPKKRDSITSLMLNLASRSLSLQNVTSQ
ncbi:hypothetical protein Mapa_011225 [Marchantia paleacea]|nr:hypothetical protein Mapa_011225 [Marchantia paleacea]